MTPRQAQFIATLISERRSTLETLGRTAPHGDDRRKAAWLLRLADGTQSYSPTPTQTSAAIEWLLALPSGTPDVPAGRYAVRGDDGVVKFYVVDRPEEGRWAGRLFLSVQASDEKHPIRNRESRNTILAAIAEDVQEAMRLYGTELGRCSCCGRTLRRAEPRVRCRPRLRRGARHRPAGARGRHPCRGRDERDSMSGLGRLGC